MTEQETKKGVNEIRDGKIMQERRRGLKKPRICMIAGGKVSENGDYNCPPHTGVQRWHCVGDGEGRVENVGKWGGTLPN